MKIRFIKNMSNKREVFLAGKDYEVDNADALRYINGGVARKAAEPSVPEKKLVSDSPAPLTPDEKVGDAALVAAATGKLREAKPEEMPERPTPASNNPAAFLHPSGAVEPHTGFTTTEPDAKTSPPSDGKSPLASHTAPEAIGSPTVGSPTGSPAAAKTSEATEDLEELTVPDLKERAKDADIEGYSTMTKAELIKALQKRRK
jgi:hypothetical protein